jgi:hypothetical protein
MAFADGHALIRKWTDRNVLANCANEFAADPQSTDLVWVQAHSTVKSP